MENKKIKLKEQLKKAKKVRFDDNQNMFDFIYFIPTRRKHDSGYFMYEIYGSKYNVETKEEEFYNLSCYSDVIDFDKVVCDFDWFCSIDMPEYNVYRIFTRNGHKFLIRFFHCSSFQIQIRKENFKDED